MVKAFHRAGIDTIMITGDQTPTAYAIARQMDLSRHHQIEILDSTNLADIDPEALRVLSERVNVFSRAQPSLQASDRLCPAESRKSGGHDR